MFPMRPLAQEHLYPSAVCIPMQGFTEKTQLLEPMSIQKNLSHDPLAQNENSFLIILWFPFKKKMLTALSVTEQKYLWCISGDQRRAPSSRKPGVPDATSSQVHGDAILEGDYFRTNGVTGIQHARVHCEVRFPQLGNGAL